METNDYWTHLGLVVAFLVTVVGPRMFQADYAEFTTFYFIGGGIVVVVATVLRLRSRPARRAVAVTAPEPAES